MKKTIILAVACLLLGMGAHAQSKKELRQQVAQLQSQLDSLERRFIADLEDEHQKVSYAFGLTLAKGMSQQKILDSLNLFVMFTALTDVQQGASQMKVEEAGTLIENYLEEVRKNQLAKVKKESEDFLAENANREEVTVLPSGLQYEVLQAGEGEMPTATDRVTTHYKGTLIDGTQFDSSYDRGEPATFPVNGVIKGWTEALQLMKTGAKWRLFIPADLAYGERGAGRDIPPNAALIFEVELLSIE